MSTERSKDTINQKMNLYYSSSELLNRNLSENKIILVTEDI